MAFISYAQNFEDVMLWRALKHVPRGRYVDIGAQHPVVDSVSKAFYEHGWRGVHVEPVPQYADLLRLDRPDETVLQVAFSDREGMLELKVFKNTGLSTAVEAYAQQHATNPAFTAEGLLTPMLQMKTALASLNGQDVHWLKIDVEGLEEQVLRGWDSTVLRPWIILIEATVPTSTELNYEAADHIIIEAGYIFVYFDGLNRFYVAPEHPELIDAFASPPNVFDEFALSGLASSEMCKVVQERHRDEIQASQQETSELQFRFNALQKNSESEIASLSIQNSRSLETISNLSNLLHQINDQLMEARRESAHFQATVSALEQRLNAILQSTSWRITSPVRLIGLMTYKFRTAARENRLRVALKNRIRAALQVAARQVVKHPKLKQAVIYTLNLSPSLKARMILAITPKPSSTKAKGKKVMLSPMAEKIFQELQTAIKTKGIRQQ